MTDGEKPGLRVDVAALVARGEDERIEFKKSLAERDKGLQTLSAMVTQDGGTVVFGITPQGKPAPTITIGANTLELLGQAIRAEIEPPIYPSIDFGSYEGVTVITITIKPTGELHTWGGRLYHRMGRETVPVDSAEFRRRLLGSRDAIASEPQQSSPTAEAQQTLPATSPLELYFDPSTPPFRQRYPDDGQPRELFRIGVRSRLEAASITNVRVRVESYTGSPDVFIDTVEPLEYMGGLPPWGQDVNPGHPVYAELLDLRPGPGSDRPAVRVYYANINATRSLSKPLPPGEWELALIATGNNVPPARARFCLTVRDAAEDRVSLRMLTDAAPDRLTRLVTT